MSEEKTEQEVSIGFAHAGERIEIEFADGRHIVPDEVINILGGTDNLEQIAPALKMKTFAEFMAGVVTVATKQKLNEFQRQIISNHFATNLLTKN